MRPDSAGDFRRRGQKLLAQTDNLQQVPMETKDGFLSACIQFQVRRGEVDKNLQEAEAGLRAAAEQDVELAVLPEMWSTSFVPEIDAALIARSEAADDRLVELSKELDMVIVGGGLIQDGDRYFNRARVLDHGKILGEYRKIHLFSPNAEHKFHSPGDKPLVVDTSLCRLGVVICYDLRFPELIRHYFYQGITALAVPSQWPEARASHWRVLLKARAIENEIFVLGCNRTGVEPSMKTGDQLAFPGDSRIIDPMGEVLAAGAGENTPLIAEIHPRKVRSMHRILPVAKDIRPETYREIWRDAWTDAAEDSSEPPVEDRKAQDRKAKSGTS
ncbi:MAG: nitrilase-related carbon-nitrogen hydrolase [Planctomycetota bacterium]|jgi:predicted amidohydrolase